MADDVGIKYLYPANYQDAPNPVPTRKVVVNFWGLSDGSGETDVIKVRLTDLMKHDGSTPTRTAIENIKYNIRGMTVRLEWDRAANAPIALLGPETDEFNYRAEGGIVDPGEDGDRTGNIIMTSLYADQGDSYDITLTVRLK